MKHNETNTDSFDGASPDGERLTRFTYQRGRVAMAAILRAMGVGPGHEVIIQAFTCVAVPEGVLACGATPVYADITATGYNADAQQIADKVTEQTRAIVSQHTFGVPSDIEAIAQVARMHDLGLIEDCCHTLRGMVGGRPLGTFGDAAFYSFEWGKPLVAGIGGAAIANTGQLARHLADDYKRYHYPTGVRTARIEAQYRAFKFLYRPRWYWAVRSAFQRLSRSGAAEGNFNAPERGEVSEDFSLRMAKSLRRRARRLAAGLDSDADNRRAIEEKYRKAIQGTDAILPEPDLDAPLARLPLRVADKASVLARARSRGIELADWYRTAIHPLTPDQMSAVGYEPGSCPHAERRASEIVSLPIHSGVDDRFIDRVADLFPAMPRLASAA